MKATEILAQHTQPLTSNIGTYWKSRMATVTGQHQYSLTVKEASQLKHLSKRLGDQTRPVIDYVLNNWWKFAVRAGVDAGVPYPAAPNIGFLLKHSAVAVDLLTEKDKPSPVPVKKKAPVQLIAADAETEVPHVMTSQELTAMLKELEDS